MSRRKILIGQIGLVVLFLTIGIYNYCYVIIPKIHEGMLLELEYPIGTKVTISNTVKKEVIESLSELKCLKTGEYYPMFSSSTISLRIYSNEKNETWPVQVYLLLERPQSSFYSYKGVVGTLPFEISEKIIQVINIKKNGIKK